MLKGIRARLVAMGAGGAILLAVLGSTALAGGILATAHYATRYVPQSSWPSNCGGRDCVRVNSSTDQLEFRNSSGSTVPISMPGISPAAGTYTNASITVDQYGRITAAAAGAAPGAGGYNSILSTGSPLTSRATVNFSGSGVSCVDNSGSARTDCTVTSSFSVNVKQAPYNCKGDGTTDDTACVQAAINAAGVGGVTFFPPGNYNLASVTSTSPLTTPTFATLEGSAFLIGSGTPAATQLHFPNVGSGTGISLGTNATIRYLFLLGPGTGTAASSTTHVQLDHAQFDTWGVGLSLTNAFYTRLQECEFHNDAIGIKTVGAYDLDLYGCTFRVDPTAIDVTDRVAALNVYGGSIEGWSTAGAIIPGNNSLVNLFGVYFESSVAGTSGVVIKNGSSQNTFVLLGNQVYLSEAAKWFDGGGWNNTTVIARGNKFIADVNSTVTPTAYYLNNINSTGGAIDIGPDDWTGVLKAGSVYVSGSPAAGSSRIHDPSSSAGFVSDDLGTSSVIKAQHFLSKGSAPSVSTNTGAGTGATVSLITGSDTSGLIQLTTGTSPVAGGTAVLITYNQSFGSAQGRPVLAAGNAAAAALSGTTQVYTDSTQNDPNSWRIMTGSGGLAASTTYKWWYHVLQ